jgi:photosystem II stability/assembly factor-like uncharacterized protein
MKCNSITYFAQPAIILVALIPITCFSQDIFSWQAKNCYDFNYLMPASKGAVYDPDVVDLALIGSKARYIFSDTGIFELSGRTGKWRKIFPQDSFQILGAHFILSNKGWAVGSIRGEKSKGIIYGYRDKRWSKLFILQNYISSLFTDVWFIDSKRGWVTGLVEEQGSAGIVLKTDDDGRTWRTQYYLDNVIDGFRAIRFANNRSGIVISSNLILVSNDGGESWHKKPVRSKELLFGMTMISEKEAWIVGGRGLVLHTTDFGESWAEIRLGTGINKPWLSDVKFINKNQGWIVGDNGTIFSTIDGGQSWQKEPSNTISYLRGVYIYREIIFAFGDNETILCKKLKRGR